MGHPLNNVICQERTYVKTTARKQLWDSSCRCSQHSRLSIQLRAVCVVLTENNRIQLASGEISSNHLVWLEWRESNPHGASPLEIMLRRHGSKLWINIPVTADIPENLHHIYIYINYVYVNICVYIHIQSTFLYKLVHTCKLYTTNHLHIQLTKHISCWVAKSLQIRWLTN